LIINISYAETNDYYGVKKPTDWEMRYIHNKYGTLYFMMDFSALAIIYCGFIICGVKYSGHI
jgi:hypothetical protein